MSNLTDPRVLFAAERTLMAWNRTSLGLIAFGFVLERSGLLLKALAPDSYNNTATFISIIVGLVFIVMGALCAFISSWQFSIVAKTLNPEETPPGYTPFWGLWVNVLVGVLGLFLGVVLGLA